MTVSHLNALDFKNIWKNVLKWMDLLSQAIRSGQPIDVDIYEVTFEINTVKVEIDQTPD